MPSTTPSSGADAVVHPLDHPLELVASDMHRMVKMAMDRIVPFIEDLPHQPAADTRGGLELAASLVEPAPETGTPFEPLLEEIFRLAATSFNAAGPGYLAYIPGGGLFHTAVADLISDAINRYVGVFAAAPGLAQLEHNVVRWFCDFIGYPDTAGGYLSSGGSLANFSAVVTARRDRLPDQFLGGTLYTSTQVHHSVTKAAALAGFPAENIRSVPVDDRFRMNIEALKDQIEADRKAGWQPFMVVGSAGTTNTGAVDDLNALADAARDHGLWLHVDATYGGFFVLTKRGRDTLAGLDRADSVSLDPHKSLFLPYGNGSLLVRDRSALLRAHAGSADYMPTLQNGTDFVDICSVSPELSRPFRGLRVWLPLKMHGIEPFRDALDEKLDLTAWMERELEAIPEIEIVARPQLTVLAFRVRLPRLDPEAADAATRLLMDGVNRRQRVHLTGTTLDGRFALRVCVLNFRTHQDRLVACRDDLVAALAEVL